ncbi:hypothetical protein AXG93_1998s1220 [Marchantia polymorpha subsp. ruderalis]|uniref:Protein kinase domain-containing protein n=1 Tax=Marchantia polymorpha subsp. ruderalis TaxID=1480154 RepID=A0A176VN95_MARPO|nr:hypothetical protein AXG93_1998s1220 [Marchantia polymorpha subsp. ruderalis]
MSWILKRRASSSKKRKGSDSEDTFARDYKKRKNGSLASPGSTTQQSNREKAAEGLTSVQGPLGPQHPYLLGDRLRRVHRIDDDQAFYDRYREDQFGDLGSGAFGKVSKFMDLKYKKDDKTDPILIDFGCCQYNRSMVRKRNSTFEQDEIFTDIELRTMSSVSWSADSTNLCYILEMFLTGQPMLQNIMSPTLDRFPPKPGTDPDALALLDYMRNPRNMQSTTVEQIMQHPWFMEERARAGLDHIIDIPPEVRTFYKTWNHPIPDFRSQKAGPRVACCARF